MKNIVYSFSHAFKKFAHEGRKFHLSDSFRSFCSALAPGSEVYGILMS